ncbi:hypothetical protein NHQ30_011053 [Ciborinia camelliae]|nr:hypothetical protein NHQ30_011053 [Ciborinia camelliae]
MSPMRNKILSPTFVHIQVGRDLKDFGVHKDIICHYSPYFKAAFNSGFQETITGVLKLPETEPEVFELFYHWLYNQELYIPDWSPTKSSTDVDDTMGLEEDHSECAYCTTVIDDWTMVDDEENDSNYDSDVKSSATGIFDHDDNCPRDLFYRNQLKLLSMLYVFADMTLIPALQNLCIESFYATTDLNLRVPVELIEYIWMNTTEGSQLRKIMIDMMVWEHAPSNYFFAGDAIPALVKDEILYTMRHHLRRATIKKKRALDIPLDNIENYHVKVEEVDEKST